jgi:tetratricopeptide (TPR) repeat protein
MDETFASYETGLNGLLAQLGRDHPRYTEALVLQRRLLENLAWARLYGDTETSRAERAQILDTLNHIALEVGDRASASFLAKFGRFTRDADGAITFVESKPVIIGRERDDARPEHLRQMLQSARKAGDRAEEGAILDELGSAYEVRRDLHQAIKHYEQAVAIARELSDHQSEAIYLLDLGRVLMLLADAEPDQRRSHLSNAVDALRQAMEALDTLEAAPLLRARTRYHLGRCYYQLGRWREAITLLEQARETFSRHKARPELAHALLELGQLYRQRQDFESAYIYLKDALRLFRRLNDTDSIAVTQEALGSLALLTARPSEAIDSLHEARRGYVALQRDERVQAVDDLLRIAHQARQPVGGTAS